MAVLVKKGLAEIMILVVAGLKKTGVEPSDDLLEMLGGNKSHLVLNKANCCFIYHAD